MRFNISREKSKGRFSTGSTSRSRGYCRNDDRYEQYVLQEYQLYRIYKMLDARQLNARLIQMTVRG